MRVSQELYLDVKRRGGRRILKFQSVCKEFMGIKKTQMDFKEIKPKTFRDYESNIKFLKKFFKNVDITSIGYEELKKYDEWRRNYYSVHKRKRKQVYKRDGLRIKGRKYQDSGSPIIIQRELNLLRSMLKWCQDQGLIPLSHPIPRFKKQIPKNKKPNTLTKDEYLTLKSHLEKTKRDYLLDTIQMILSSGLRYPSEIVNLRWRDVYETFLEVRGKGDKIRRIPIRGTTSERIIGKMRRRWFKVNGVKRSEETFPNPDDFVFINKNGQRFQSVRKSFKNSLRECGLDSSIRLYSFRSSFVTRMLEEGLQPTSLCKILGHSDLSLLLRVYGDVEIPYVVEEVERIHKRRREKYTKKPEDSQ